MSRNSSTGGKVIIPLQNKARQTNSLTGSHFGADDGSRTHLIGLGSRSSTDELHPHFLF